MGAATAAVNAARAAAKTDGERRKVAEMAAYVFTAGGQYARAAAELESVGAPAKQLAPLYYQAGQYDKAIATARRAGGAEMQTLIAQSYLRTGKYKQAAATYQALLKGNPGSARYLENLAGAQYKMGDKAAYLATTERLIRVDASPARWKTLLIELKKEKMSRESKLALFHLMRETGNVNRPEDYQEFAKLAIVSSQPGVAKAVLDKAGIAASDPMTARLLQAATQKADEAAAGVGKLPGTPAGRFQAGNVLLGMGDNAGAIKAFDAAIAGKASADQATVFKGIAQVRSGGAVAARSTFKSLPEGSSMKDVAALWALYASTRR